jgi:hypothetical protein
MAWIGGSGRSFSGGVELAEPLVPRPALGRPLLADDARGDADELSSAADDSKADGTADEVAGSLALARWDAVGLGGTNDEPKSGGGSAVWGIPAGTAGGEFPCLAGEGALENCDLENSPGSSGCGRLAMGPPRAIGPKLRATATIRLTVSKTTASTEPPMISASFHDPDLAGCAG